MKLGPWEIGLILVIVLIIFGAGKLATIGRDLGKAIRGFKEESKMPEEKTAATDDEEEVVAKPVVRRAVKKTTKPL